MSTEDSLGPVKDNARIDVMDILRGFALFGIVFMNVEWFNRSSTNIRSFDASLTGMDHAIGWLIRAFIEGKFYTLFALLFGMGFAVMLSRAKEAGRPYGAWFVRRMLVLMVIGYAHAILIWDGDIVHDYAFAGLVFLGWIYLFETRWLRRFNTPTTFLKIGISWLVLPLVLATLAGIVVGTQTNQSDITQQLQRNLEISAAVEQGLAEPDAEIADEEVATRVKARLRRIERAEEQEAVASGGSYMDTVRYRASRLGPDAGNMVFFTLIILLPIFLIGYWFIASGVLKRHQEQQQLFRLLAIIGLVFGTILSVGGLLLMQYPIQRMSRSIWNVAFWLLNFGQLVMAAGYLGLIVTLTGNAVCYRVLKWLAPFGRMALTNYIMQSVILVALFYGFAGGLYGEVSRSEQMLVVIGIVAFQVAFSAWWLNRFRFGPLEWLWRSATYMSWQPLKR